ncbi:hypothetical protein QVD17_37368 [Tagetes erecta]|uniref:Wall-associated receptor kinase galacturonan-binding domain-containing protein n=1 Tax=Tagetes erecta TaxID=13708 RepID=A0AAD8JUG9_TARER|nr:hypothetical protein QVD17_37368 [Tagetes erecta]
MNLFQAYLHLLILLPLTTASTIIIPKYAKTGCFDTCGNNVTIPYPFGIGASCSVNPWFIVDCISSKPYLSALNHLEIFKVDLDNQTVTVSSPRITDCQNQLQNNTKITSINLHSTPFMFCSYRNRFILHGCGSAVMMDNESVLTGCSTSCLNETVIERNNECFGFSCCQTTVPHYLKSYSINLMGLSEDGGCGYAFLLDDDSYLKGWFPVNSVEANNAFAPVSLMWSLPRSTELTCCTAADHMKVELDMGNGVFVESQKCSRHIGYKGNPYLSDGCAVIGGCASCPYSSCNYDIIYSGDGSRSKITNFTCGPNPSPTRFGVKASMGVILEGRATSTFDATLIKEGTTDELLAIANLAMRCLNLNGRYRPTMKEVATELETIRASHIPPTVQTNIRPTTYGEELSFITYSNTSSTFMGLINDSISP